MSAILGRLILGTARLGTLTDTSGGTIIAVTFSGAGALTPDFRFLISTTFSGAGALTSTFVTSVSATLSGAGTLLPSFGTLLTTVLSGAGTLTIGRFNGLVASMDLPGGQIWTAVVRPQMPIAYQTADHTGLASIPTALITSASRNYGKTTKY